MGKPFVLIKKRLFSFFWGVFLGRKDGRKRRYLFTYVVSIPALACQNAKPAKA